MKVLCFFGHSERRPQSTQLFFENVARLQCTNQLLEVPLLVATTICKINKNCMTREVKDLAYFSSRNKSLQWSAFWLVPLLHSPPKAAGDIPRRRWGIWIGERIVPLEAKSHPHTIVWCIHNTVKKGFLFIFHEAPPHLCIHFCHKFLQISIINSGCGDKVLCYSTQSVFLLLPPTLVCQTSFLWNFLLLQFVPHDLYRLFQTSHFR